MYATDVTTAQNKLKRVVFIHRIVFIEKRRYVPPYLRSWLGEWENFSIKHRVRVAKTTILHIKVAVIGRNIHFRTGDNANTKYIRSKDKY